MVNIICLYFTELKNACLQVLYMQRIQLCLLVLMKCFLFFVLQKLDTVSQHLLLILTHCFKMNLKFSQYLAIFIAVAGTSNRRNLSFEMFIIIKHMFNFVPLCHIFVNLAGIFVLCVMFSPVNVRFSVRLLPPLKYIFSVTKLLKFCLASVLTTNIK